jgi:hypothetical protein
VTKKDTSFLKKSSKKLLGGCRGPCRQRTPGRKRFLVLFFKKEHLLRNSPALVI